MKAVPGNDQRMIRTQLVQLLPGGKFFVVGKLLVVKSGSKDPLSLGCVQSSFPDHFQQLFFGSCPL